ncbi:hypothetical protein M8494_04985 [Serratia ureilytica]
MQEAFTEGKDETQWLKGMYDDMKTRRAPPVALPPFDMFWQSNNYVRFRCRRPISSGCASPIIATTRC